MILGVDLDGVCANYTDAFREVVAFDKGVPLNSLTDKVTWDYTEWGIEDREEFLRLHLKGVEQGMFYSMKPMPGVSESLWRLSDAGVWIRIITHRLAFNGHHGAVATDTIQWLERHNIPYRDLCFIGDKPQVDADLYVDDSPKYIEPLAEAGKDVIVFDQPYNQHISSHMGWRAFDWADVEEIVLEEF